MLSQIMLMVACTTLVSSSELFNERNVQLDYDADDDQWEWAEAEASDDTVRDLDPEALGVLMGEQESSIDEPSSGHSTNDDSSFALPDWFYTKSVDTHLYQRRYYEKLKEGLIKDDTLTYKIGMLDSATVHLLSPDNICQIWTWMFAGGCKLREKGFNRDAVLWLIGAMKYFVKDIKAAAGNTHLQKGMFLLLDDLIGSHELDVCKLFSKEVDATDDIKMFAEMVQIYQHARKDPGFWALIKTFVPQ